MAKLTEYNAAETFDDGDILIKDGVGGTKKINVSDAANEFRRLCGLDITEEEFTAIVEEAGL